MTEYEASQVIDSYLTLPEVFMFYGYEIRHGGFCCCPFHHEKTPSCKVNNFQFHCFGCSESGNILSFVKKIFNIDFKTAMQKINDDFHLGLLSSQLTAEQQKQIKKRQIAVYEKKQENEELKTIEEEYNQSWKHYVIYKPEDKNYDINTDENLVDEFFENIDKRFIKAQETINRLEMYADLNWFKLDYDTAKFMFTK